MKQLVVLVSILFLASCQNTASWMGSGEESGFSAQNTMAAGIKEALTTSTENASQQLSMEGAFQLALPEGAQPVAKTLRQFGMGRYVDQLENAMNRGAEKAVAEAKPVFKQAIRDMSITDALGIVRGDSTAATDYFRGKTESSLRERYQPIVESSLRKTGFYDQYQSMLSVYENLPLTDKPNMDLEDHVINRSMDKLYTQIGEQESGIRANPMQYGSKLLGQVFQASQE